MALLFFSEEPLGFGLLRISRPPEKRFWDGSRNRKHGGPRGRSLWASRCGGTVRDMGTEAWGIDVAGQEEDGERVA